MRDRGQHGLESVAVSPKDTSDEASNSRGHHSLETKNMMPAAKERLNLSKAEKWAKERIPAMMPAKQDMAERIMKARVAFQ